MVIQKSCTWDYDTLSLKISKTTKNWVQKSHEKSSKSMFLVTHLNQDLYVSYDFHKSLTDDIAEGNLRKFSGMTSQ